MPIIGNSIRISGNNRLYLLKGLDQCADVTGGWSALAYWRANGDGNYNNNHTGAPTVTADTPPYIILENSNTGTNTGTRLGCYRTGSMINFSAYSKLIMVYDVVAFGSSTANYYARLSLVARTTTSFPSGGNQITGQTYIERNYTNGSYSSSSVTLIDASTKLEDQEMELNISSINSAFVTIGMNQNNGRTGLTVTIKKIYAVK